MKAPINTKTAGEPRHWLEISSLIKLTAWSWPFFLLLFSLSVSTHRLCGQTPIALPGDSLARTHDDRGNVRARYPDPNQVESYQSSRDYQYDRDTTPPQSLIGKILAWISEKFGELMRSSVYTNYGQYLVLAIIAALTVWLLVKAEVLGFMFPKKPETTSLAYENLAENIHEISFDDRIDEALARRDYRLGVRLLYLQTLKQLTDRGLIAWQPNKTNRQYAQELAGSPLRPDFEQLTTQFEFVWYGDFPIDEQRYGEVAATFRQFEKAETNLAH